MCAVLRGRRIDWMCSSVEVALRALDLVDVLVRPLRERGDGSAQRFSERREFVLDARRDFRVNRALDQAVAFEIAQRLREHLLRDAADHAAQLVEAPALALREDTDNERRP